MENQKYSIRDLQIKLLEIIDYVDELCEKNAIKYYLIGGSALGAVRHEGFIPWDDDFDIAMTWDNYSKFMKICETQLDTKLYYFQKERSKGWPLYFSKLKMNNTVFKETDSMEASHPGIFIDIFCLENIADGFFLSRWQYLCSKIVLAQTLGERGYKTANNKKKIIIQLVKVLRFNKVESFFIKQVRRYNKIKTRRIGLLFGVSNFNTAIIPREFIGKGKLVKFENRLLPVPEMTDKYLTNYFGDYLKLPPIEKQYGHMPKEIKL